MSLGNLNVSKIEQFGKQTRADTSLRSVLSDLENLEYGINIFKNMKWEFGTQLQEPEQLKIIFQYI